MPSLPAGDKLLISILPYNARTATIRGAEFVEAGHALWIVCVCVCLLFSIHAVRRALRTDPRSAESAFTVSNQAKMAPQIHDASNVSLEADVHATLGDSPSWDAENQRLLSVDINSKKIFIFNPETKQNAIVSLQEMVGAVGLAGCRYPAVGSI